MMPSTILSVQQWLDADPGRRVVALLDQLAGAGEGDALLRRLLDGDVPPRQIAQSIAASATLAQIYKEVRTLDIGVDGRKDADAAYVGLPPPIVDLTFAEQFEQHFRPRLGKRAEGFAAIFDALGQPCDNILLVETGCMRIAGNWEGDGQSTFMFDALARDRDGRFFSIDVTPESIDTARHACSSATQLILNDSVAALHALSRTSSIRASLLYLDSYDVDIANPLPSAIHHILELTAAGPLIGSGTIVCIDDYGLGLQGGKGMIVDMFFSSIRAQVLHCSYQKVWRVP